MTRSIGLATAFVLTIGSVTGCTMTPEGLDVRRRDQSAAVYPTFGKPIVLDGSRYVVVPFSVQRPQDGTRFDPSSGFSFASFSSPVSASWSGSGSGFFSAGNTHWNNLVFYDSDGG